jgi:hypothetical protein
MKTIIIEIEDMLEIPLAYKEAITKYRGGEEDYNDDVWNAKIELKQINFEYNSRRSNYECVFKITEGDFLERYKQKESDNAE